MAPDELARIWALVCEQVRTAEQVAVVPPSQPAVSDDEDEDAASESDSGTSQSEDNAAAARLPWSPEGLRAQYRAAAAEVARRQWDSTVAAVVAMCNVGCRTEPPQDVVQALADVVSKSVRPRDFQALLDVATAFGCGWSRNALAELPKGLSEEAEREHRKSGPWDLHWNRALTRLFWLIEKRARLTIASLSRMGVKFPGPEPSALAAAGVVRNALVHPVGPIDDRPVTVECRDDETGVFFGRFAANPLRYGARMVLHVSAEAKVWGPPRANVDYPRPAPAGSRLLVLARIDETRVKCVPHMGDEWEVKLSPGEKLVLEPPGKPSRAGWARWLCSCGTDNCQDQHRLSAWNPASQSLEEFVRVAVSGVTTATLKAGQVKQFTSGTLAANWAAQGLEGSGRLVLQPLEYNLCVECASNPQIRDPAFLAHRCSRHVPPSLHRAEDPTVARDRLLLLDTELPIYESQMRWACPRSGFLHKEEAVRRVVRKEVFDEVKEMIDRGQRPPRSLVLQIVKERWCTGAGADGSPCEPCLKRGKATDRGAKLSIRPTFVWVPTPNAPHDLQRQMQIQADAGDGVGHPLGDDDVSPKGDDLKWNPAPASFELAAGLIAEMAHHVSPESDDEADMPTPGSGPHEEPALGDARDQEEGQ